MSAKTSSGDREERLAEERLLLLTQSIIQRELNRRGLKYRDLARQIGVSEARVSQLLGDDAPNLTVRTVARILYRLGEAGVFMTQKDELELLNGISERQPVAWIVAGYGEHLYMSGEVAEFVFDDSPAKPRPEEWHAWLAAEAATENKRFAR